jgi:hypothetical protein
VIAFHVAAPTVVDLTAPYRAHEFAQPSLDTI